eukprot:gene66991-91742_t
MAIDDDDKPKKKVSHEIGQDLSLLSVEELADRIALLNGEIQRLQSSMTLKRATRDAADRCAFGVPGFLNHDSGIVPFRDGLSFLAYYLNCPCLDTEWLLSTLFDASLLSTLKAAGNGGSFFGGVRGFLSRAGNHKYFFNFTLLDSHART